MKTKTRKYIVKMTNLFKELNTNTTSDNENIGNPRKKKLLKMEILELKRTKKIKLLDRQQHIRDGKINTKPEDRPIEIIQSDKERTNKMGESQQGKQYIMV